jgi:hypothetical protein
MVDKDIDKEIDDLYRETWLEQHPDYYRDYYAIHKAKLLAQHRKWLKENRERRNRYMREYMCRKRKRGC